MTIPPAMPWVKLHTSYLEDSRFARLGDPQKARFFELLMLAGKLDAGGYFIEHGRELSEAEIAWKLRLQAEQLCQDLEALASVELACKNGHGWCLTDFESEQGPTQADKRALWKARQKKHRSHGSVTGDDTVTNADVTPADIESDKEEEEEEEEEERKEIPAATTALTNGEEKPGGSTPGDEVALKQVPYNGYTHYPENPNEASADPIIRLFEDVTGRLPGDSQYKLVIETILYIRKSKTKGLQSVVDYLKPFWLAWSTRRGQNGKLYNPSNLTWLTEWAVNGSVPALDQVSPNYISPEETRKRLDEADKQEHVPPPADVLAQIKKIVSKKKVR
jgi:hypothetical protein